jgi:CheY-like chemotaxis protein
VPTEPTQKLRVLIVDDDAASAKLLSVILRTEGHETREADSAERALQILHDFSADVIVLDLVLPLMSGLLLAQRLQADPRTRDLPLIAVTAFNGPALERAALDSGCRAFIRKPIDAAAFAQLVLSLPGRDP